MGNAAAFANFAHQVVEVKPGSPAAKSGLCAGEDYVIVFDGFLLTQLSPQEILCVVTNAVNQDVEALVYNAVQNSTRTISLHPSKAWLLNNMTLDDVRLSTNNNLLGVTILLKPCVGFHSSINCPPISDLLVLHNKKKSQMNLISSPYSNLSVESGIGANKRYSASTLPIQFVENDENENLFFNENPLQCASFSC